MKYTINIFTTTSIPLIISMMLLYNNTFISLEIPIININSIFIPMSFLIDWISLMFTATVMFISSMILMFSMFYMPKKEHNKFSILLIMFMLSMMTLIISDNIIFILLGWDSLGLSSYILVIYYQNHTSAASGTITLLSNRIGDIMILLSISIIMTNNNWYFIMNNQYNLISLILMMIAAFSKSAQFPFSAWLPAAMAAPTPISALVHSSTLVTAGVFLLIRVLDKPHNLSLSIMMIISSATALYASMAANWEFDMKKIIALSTLSQIAMMMFAISLNSPLMAFFHLITHAMFKSTMFLTAGILIHKSSYQDMRMMSMNFTKLPLTMSILTTSSMALMAIPFMSGFFSKDIIIEMMLHISINSMLSYTMIFSIGLTSLYTIRMLLLSFNNSMKSKPDSNFHKINNANKSIMFMIPMSIFLGMSLMWILNPEQMLMMPNKLKMMMLITLTLGLMTGAMMSYKKTLYMKLGYSAISIWFMHYCTSVPLKTFSPLMYIINKNDQTWQENYGPQGTISMNSNLAKIPNLLKMTSTFTLIMFTLIPLM